VILLKRARQRRITGCFAQIDGLWHGLKGQNFAKIHIFLKKCWNFRGFVTFLLLFVAVLNKNARVRAISEKCETVFGNCGKNKELERLASPSEAKNALVRS